MQLVRKRPTLCRVLELCGGVSFVGLCLSLNREATNASSAVLVRPAHDAHAGILAALAKENCATSLRVESGDGATLILRDSDKSFDLVLLDLVDSAGLIRQNALEEFEAMKVVFRSRLPLVVAPRIIPSRLSVVVVPTECPWIMTQNSVIPRIFRFLSLSHTLTLSHLYFQTF